MRRTLSVVAILALVAGPAARAAEDEQFACQQALAGVAPAVNASPPPRPICEADLSAGPHEFALGWTPGAFGRLTVDVVPAEGPLPYRLSCAVEAGLAACESEAAVPTTSRYVPLAPGGTSSALAQYRVAFTVDQPVTLRFAIADTPVVTSCSAACTSLVAAVGLFRIEGW